MRDGGPLTILEMYLVAAEMAALLIGPACRDDSIDEKDQGNFRTV
jgi:hypothetical protein